MFETYTERARRVIFFSRYEASQFGSPYIESEHILLGILREDKVLINCFLSYDAVEAIRKQIEQHSGGGPQTSTSVDLPLSHEAKRVLSYAAEETERLAHKHIGAGHLLLGLLREEKSFAAELLHSHGVRVETVREQVAKPETRPILVSSRRELETSIVSITSTPTGAEIYLNDKFLGNTPAEVPLTVGEWAVRLIKHDFEPWEKTLLILPAAKQTLSVDLTPLE